MEKRTIKQNIRKDTLRFVLALAGIVFGIGFGIYLYQTGELMNGAAPKYLLTMSAYCLMVYRIMTGTLKRRYVGITDEKIEQSFGEILGTYFTDSSLKKQVYQAIRMIVNQDYAKAAKKLKQLEKECKSNGQKSALYYLRGKCAFQENDSDEAFACLRQACDLRPGFVKALLYAAVFCEERNDYAAAERYIMEAKEWAPENPEVYETLTVYYFKTRQIEQTMEAARIWERLDAKSEDAAAYICIAAAFQQDFLLAEEYYRKSEILGYEDLKSLWTIIDAKKKNAGV